MVLKIRLAKGGCHKSPLYQIVLAHIRSPRDRKHVEKLGYYDPLPNANGTKQIALNLERTKYWIGNNVQVSDTAHKILAKAGLLPPKPLNEFQKASIKLNEQNKA